jgi:cytochrome b561
MGQIIAGVLIPTTSHRTRYSGIGIALHWLTTLLVVTQFALAELWGFTPRPTRHLMIVTHLSFGIVLTLVLIVRIAWRLTSGRCVPAASTGRGAPISKTMHLTLYVLLATEAMLGFTLRWSGHQPMSFFGLAIPSPFASLSQFAHRLMGTSHDRIAWAIVFLATGHALTAAFRHFVLRDHVLWRMLPGRSSFSSATDPQQ